MTFTDKQMEICNTPQCPQGLPRTSFGNILVILIHSWLLQKVLDFLAGSSPRVFFAPAAAWNEQAVEGFEKLPFKDSFRGVQEMEQALTSM